jgi:hypothetical protein
MFQDSGGKFNITNPGNYPSVAFTINTSGNVGIGTTSPDRKLTVYSTNDTRGILIHNTSTTSYAELHFSASREYRIGTGGSSADSSAAGKWYVYDGTAAAHRFTIDSNGSVGIGTTSPIAKLDISGDVRTTGAITINGSSIPSDRWFEVTGTTSGKVFGAVFNPTFTYTGANLYGIYVGNNFGTGTITNSYNLYIEGTSVGSATITNRFGLYQAGASDRNYFAGNVGIGTTSPDAIFHVAKSNSTGIGGQIVIDNNAGSAVGNAVEISFITDAGASGAGTRNARILAVNDNAGNGAANMQFHTWNGSASAERVRISNDGNVGIGTTSPTSPLLVYRDSDVWHARFGASGGELRIGGSTSSGAVIQSYTPGGTVRDLYIQRDGGSVGIGTTSPGATLDVRGNSLIYKTGADTYLTVQGNSAYDAILELKSDQGGIASEGFQMWYVNNVGDVHFATTYNDNAASMHFHTRTGGDKSTSNERLTILGGGNVGIGATSPTGLLEVYKSASGGLGGHIILNNNGSAVANETAIIFQDGGVDAVRAAISSTTEGAPYLGDIKFKTGLTTYGSLSTRMIITGAGNVGIGTTSPGSLLHVNGRSYIGTMTSYAPAVHIRGAYYGGPRLQVYGLDADANGWMGLGTDMSSAPYELSVYYSTNGASSVCFGKYDGTASQYGGFTPTARLSNAGTWTVAGDVVAYGSPSDITLKTNIKPIQGALEIITKLQGVSFTWKEDTEMSKMTNLKDDIGFIAQEVQEILPDLVRKNDNGLLSLRDKGITALLVEAIKEQQQQIDELKYLLQNK